TEHIVNGLIRGIKASKAVLILLGIQLTFFSLLGFTLFSNIIPEYFGDPLRSMNTIFGIFTIENWGAVPEAAKALNQPYIYYSVNAFVIMVLVLGGFIALSLANAIFVDEMASDNNDDLMAEIKSLKSEISEIKGLLKNGDK
ncbi:ion transporter, partial [Vibrio rarus]